MVESGSGEEIAESAKATDFPRLLVVSEFTMSTTRSGALSNPTMFNLFEGYSPERMAWLAPSKWTRQWPPHPPFDSHCLEYRDPMIPRPSRGTRFFNPILDRFEFQVRDLLSPPRLKEIREFDPEVVLVTPFLPGGLLVGERLIRELKRPSIVYFMDNWPANDKRRWLTGGIEGRVRSILSEADSWIMISEELRDAMVRSYSVIAKPTLVAHNPVEIAGLASPVMMPRREGRFRVVYAGSVQTMHADAVLAVAEAIHRLRSEGIDIEFVLHAPDWVEESYRELWRRYNVTIGGLVPYDELPRVLRDADLLLVGLSFNPNVAHMAMFSLLTKITDYMATGVPILVCGPSGSASVNFVKRWDCGLTCETNDVGSLVEAIRVQISRPESNAALARRAWNCLQSQFSTARVRERLYSFIRAVGKRETFGRAV